MELKLKLTSEQLVTKDGKSCKVEKDGKEYDCLIYSAPVEPSEILGTKARELTRRSFKLFEQRRLRINRSLREIASSTIVYPEYEFISNHHWVELFEINENIVPRNQTISVINGLTTEEKCRLLKSIIGSVSKLHEKGIVCGEMTPDRLVLFKTKEGHYLAKLICNGYCYFSDDITTECPPYSEEYQSPEMYLYRRGISDRVSSYHIDSILKQKAGEKWPFLSDVFSVGLFMHWFLTGGALPESLYTIPALGIIHKSESGCDSQLKLDGKRIGNPRLISLISDMLQKNAQNRPNITQVYDFLNDAEKPILCKMHERHSFTINNDEFKKKACSLSIIESNDDSEQELYQLIDLNGIRHIVGADDLLTEGLVTGFDSPWPEHHVLWSWKFISRDNVRGICRLQGKNGNKLYQIIDAERGGRTNADISKMKKCGYATAVPAHHTEDLKTSKSVPKACTGEKETCTSPKRSEIDVPIIDRKLPQYIASASSKPRVEYLNRSKVSHYEDFALWEEDQNEYMIDNDEARKRGFIGRVVIELENCRIEHKYAMRNIKRFFSANELCTMKIFKKR